MLCDLLVVRLSLMLAISTGSYSLGTNTMLKPTDASFNISGVIPCDFNYDGRLDVLLMLAKPGTEGITMEVFLGNFNEFGNTMIILVVPNYAFFIVILLTFW